MSRKLSLFVSSVTLLLWVLAILDYFLHFLGSEGMRVSIQMAAAILSLVSLTTRLKQRGELNRPYIVGSFLPRVILFGFIIFLAALFFVMLLHPGNP